MIRNSVPRYVIADSGFWIALCDPKDSHSVRSSELFDALERVNFVVPWPLFYEVLSTRLARRKAGVERFERVLRSIAIEKIDDSPYRDEALEETIRAALSGRSLSLVDTVVRGILSDRTIRVECLVTYNTKDYLDICSRRGMPVVDSVKQLRAH